MLVEDTGTQLLDSGSGYGRHHERNRMKTLRAFQSEAAVMLDLPQEPCPIGDITYSISVFHYLKNQLTLDLLCQEFNQKNKAAKDHDATDFIGVGAKVEKWLKSNNSVKVHSPVNTYNYQSSLSQVLQYTPLTINDNPYIVLQIHGGCDVRGGYTNGRMFKVENDYSDSIALLNLETVQVTVEKPDGWRYGCSNSFDGVNLKVDDGEIYPPVEQIQMDLGIVMPSPFHDLVVNPAVDKIHAWLGE